MSAMRTYKMPIRSIRSAGMRDRLDWSRVALYRQMLRDGRRPPPVHLLHRLGDGRWQLGDAAHRMTPARFGIVRSSPQRAKLAESVAGCAV